MKSKAEWTLFNIDSMLEETGEHNLPGSTIDLWVSALAFKNFDFVEKRLPFLVECRTWNVFTWLRIIDAAPLKYWIKDVNEGVAVFEANEHCGCIRTYRLGPGNLTNGQQWDRKWHAISSESAFYSLLDTPAANSIYSMWHNWVTHTTERATELADGRQRNTAAARSLIFTSITGCAVCSDNAVGYANTTVGWAGKSATLIQLPLCAAHLELAQAEPNVLTYLSKIFSLSIDLPLSGLDAIPDSLIPMVHHYVASQLGGIVGKSDKRSNGWHLEIALDYGWCWKLRLRSLSDYAYMLFKPGQKKALYRADSARDHPELSFFPYHEHSSPDQKNDAVRNSYLYGMPIFDLKRLRNVSIEFGALKKEV